MELAAAAGDAPLASARAPRTGLGARIYTTMLVFTCPDTCAAAGTRYRYSCIAIGSIGLLLQLYHGIRIELHGTPLRQRTTVDLYTLRQRRPHSQ